MAIFTAAIDPVTRLEGHLKIEVNIDKVNGVQQVVDAWSIGTLFRGFEKILINRDPRDAQHITERICGVCPVAHGATAVLCLDNAFGISAPENARLMRNLVAASNYLDSHILHFYLLVMPDFINMPAMPPWQPNFGVDRRIDANKTATIVNHYLKAIEMRRKAHEMGAIFGGRLPHPPGYTPGGFTCLPTADRITLFNKYIDELIPFIKDVYIPDVEYLASVYSDYFSIGRGHGNLLSYGVFEENNEGDIKLFKRGRIVNGEKNVLPVDVNQITEHVTYSWYDNSINNLPPSSGDTVPKYPKDNAYTWLKAPRYEGKPYECGPLARMIINGNYKNGISVMDRNLARAYEALIVANAMKKWVNQIVVGESVFTQFTIPQTGQGVGLTEAPRGAIGHWISISNRVISRYQVITPSCWTFSPRDTSGIRGPLEEALIGTPIENVDEPVEVLRIIHSVDPCLDCAVHLIDATKNSASFSVGHIHDETDGHNHTHDHNHTHSHCDIKSENNSDIHPK